MFSWAHSNLRKLSATPDVGRCLDDVPDWSNLKLLHRGTLPPRASFFPYTSAQHALDYNPEQSQSLCLSGNWKFQHSTSPYKTPLGFEKPTFDSSDWDDVQVPGMWQMQGYGNPHYTSEAYPFPVNPPHIPADENETGSYLYEFKVPSSMSQCQLRLRFEGVDSAFHVWTNGHEIGYSQGSRNPSEFDITDHVFVAKKNTLAVRVYQFCDGSYIEDQDQWWLSGIFRDVFLLAFPISHIQDYHIKTKLDDSYQDAILSVEVMTNGKGTLKVILFDGDKLTRLAETSVNAGKSGSTLKISIPVDVPRKWTAEDPYLYHLLLQFGEQFVAQRIGFRTTEIKDGIFTVNGKRVVFRGVNRHEHHPAKGRAVGYDPMRQDLVTMKLHNINAIRTSHQPNDYRLYDLADEFGFWIIDEADLECHGFANVEETALSEEDRARPHDEKKAIVYGNAGTWITNNREWEEAYVDRMRHLVTRDKNHASVIMWSMGNEAFWGANFRAMYDWAKAYDPTRLIHYEPDTQAQIADVYSMMYPSLDIIREFANEWQGKKPLLLCEYSHAMGNGPGAIKHYIDEFYTHPCLQGGFVWEWANHGLLTKNKMGEKFYGYGGDFGDEPNDGNFVMDGLLFSDHTPSPGLIEYKKAIEPVQLVSGTSTTAVVVNRYDFANLNQLQCSCFLVADGEERELGEVAIPSITPGETAEVQIPGAPDIKKLRAQTYLDLSFRLRNSTLWAGPGHEVARLQYCIHEVSEGVANQPIHQVSVSIYKIGNMLEIKGKESVWKIDSINGVLSSWQKHGKEMIHSPLILDVFRPLTDNDVGNVGKEWKAKFVHLVKQHLISVEWRLDSNGKNSKTRDKTAATVICTHRIAPPVLDWCVLTTTTYTFSSDAVQITVNGKVPTGKTLPSCFPRIGFTFALTPDFDSVRWFGRGPGEGYRDKKLSQLFGNYERSIDELWTPYEFPQEAGNRTDVRWVRFSTSCAAAEEGGQESDEAESSITVTFMNPEGCNFQASHYAAVDVDAARHPFELERKKKEEVIVRLDLKHNGLGTGSCGPGVLPEYTLKPTPFEFKLLLA